MNQNFFDQLSFTKQFYRAFGNYYGVPTTTTSQASEYLSSARTQPSILKKQKSSPKPLISLKKPLTSNSIRVKTQTQHIPKQQTISHHVKSLSSDIKTHAPQKQARTERTVFQTEPNQHPFLIIQKKAKELRRLESRKSTQEQVKSESQHSVQSSLKIRTVESPVNVPLIPQIPIIQISEPHEQETPKISERAQEQESEEQAKEPQEAQEQNSFSSSKMKRVSVKLKFKNAVQSQVSTLFINKQPKSLFNIIISPEFSLKHELERQKISECFEAGNFILCKALAMTTKTQNIKEQYIKQRYPIKHSHKMNNIVTTQVIKLQTTNKAFQRKIKMIITTTDNNKEEQPQQFSLLSKLKKSQFQKWQSNDLLEPGIENYKDQITITITNDLKEDTIHTFMRPKFSKIMDSVIEDVQVSSPTKSNITNIRKAIQHSGSLHQSSRQIMLRHSITQNAIKDEYSNCTATTPNIEEANNLDFNLEFSKANLYVRLYYQKVLHKLPRKTNFSSLNLQEIEDDFVAQQLLIKTSNINFQTTDVQGVEQLCPTLAFEQKVDIQKYFVPQMKWEPAVNFDRQSTYSSSSSDEIVSLDQILEEPNQRLSNPHEHETKLQNIIKSMKDIKDDSCEQIFIEDMQKNHTLSTGQLVPIKKARNHFHWPLDLKCIISVLDQQTKNILLTFRQKEISIEEILGRMNQDTDGQAFKLLDKYYRYSQLRHRIIDEMTMRYDSLLVGRYRDEQSVIDIEHKETTLENILENTKLSEMKPLDLSKPLSQSQRYKKPESQILEIVKLKKQVHQSNKLNKNSQKLTSKQTNTSPENNISKQQYSNQLTSQLTNNNNNNNIITQSTTQYLTKPTNQSQQSMNGQKVYKKSKSNNADLSDSSSAKSIKSKSELNSSQLISNQIQKSQQYLEVQQDKKDRHKQTKSQTVSVQNNDSKLQSMQQSSLRMRSHAYQCEQRQKYDQKYQVKFSIEDNNYQEFLENLVHLPEMYLDNRFENNDTFLTMAAQNGNVDIVKELIKRGADINIQNDDGNTPLHLALAYNHYGVADILMQSGASSHIFNKSGKNAWSVL